MTVTLWQGKEEAKQWNRFIIIIIMTLLHCCKKKNDTPLESNKLLSSEKDTIKLQQQQVIDLISTPSPSTPFPSPSPKPTPTHALLEPRLRLLARHLVRCPNSSSRVLALGDSSSRSPHDDIEISSENSNSGVVLDSEICPTKRESVPPPFLATFPLLLSRKELNHTDVL